MTLVAEKSKHPIAFKPLGGLGGGRGGLGGGGALESLRADRRRCSSCFMFLQVVMSAGNEPRSEPSSGLFCTEQRARSEPSSEPSSEAMEARRRRRSK